MGLLRSPELYSTEGMNLQELSAILESFTPTGFEYWAGGSRSEYNMKKKINDTMLVVLPNPFPLQWRSMCWHTVKLSVWFGKVIDLKRTTTGEQQHDPYSSIELMDGMYDTANDFLAQLNANDYIQVFQDITEATFYDSPDGKSVNRQVWLEVPLTLKIYWTGDSFDYYFDQTFES